MAVLLDGVDLVGNDIPLRFVIGQQINIDVQIVNRAGVAVDITGRTYTVRIGTLVGAVVASFIISLTDPTNGIFRISLDTSSGIPAGSYVWEAWEQGNNFLWSGAVEVISSSIV